MFGSCHCSHAQLPHLLYFSHFLYPCKSWRGEDNCGEEAPSSGDGKYELLAVANNLIAEEIKNVMLKSKYYNLINVFAADIMYYYLHCEMFTDSVSCCRSVKAHEALCVIAAEVQGNSTGHYVGWISCQSSLLYPFIETSSDLSFHLKGEGLDKRNTVDYSFKLY